MSRMEEQTEQVELPKSLEELKKHLKSKNLVFGTERTMKLLRLGRLAKAFLSSNTPKNVVDDCEYYGKLSGTEVVKLELLNEDLGTFCKKTFSVAVIGLMK